MNTLYSFRRCPYAIRARFALLYAGVPFELREVKLSNKPPEMLALSPKGTVPVLQLTSGKVLDESVDIVNYALSQNDPDNYALTTENEKKVCQQWLDEWQPLWVTAIKHYKYHDRYPELNREQSWHELKQLLEKIEDSLKKNQGFILRNSFSKLDILLLPLIRQFAIIDRDFFIKQPWPFMHKWLDDWVSSSIYTDIMKKNKSHN